MFNKLRQCPKCKSSKLQRRKRKGFIQNVILTRMGIYPWVCLNCKHRFNLAIKSGGDPMDSSKDYARFAS